MTHRPRRPSFTGSTVVVAAALAAAPAAFAQVDTLETVVNGANATGGKAIGTFGYDPTSDRMYVSSFGFAAPGGQPALRRVDNVGGTQSVVPLVSEAELQLFYRDGNPDRNVGTPLQSGLLLNPLPVGTGPGAVPAYSFALINDASFTRFPASTHPTPTTDPAATKRLYSYNLQPVPTGGDGRDVFTTRVTLADMQAAVGTTNATSNTGRQFAWSGDGQSVYFTDTSTTFGGLWKAGALGGTVTRLLAADDINTEPAVVREGNTDRIYVRGGGTTNNAGGIDVVTHDGTTTSARTVAVSAAAMRDFLELPANQSITPASMAADADGNLYFNNTASGTNRRGLFKLDAQGRLAKVVGFSERQSEFSGAGNLNSNMLRLQPRTISYAGPEGSYNLTQVLYAENHIDAVAGANVFKTGDFNRDNAVDFDDVALFAPQLTTRGVAKTNASDLKFDLNGNDAVDWKDVKIFQQFYAFPDGDAGMDRLLNFVDLDTVGANYLGTSKTWVLGDFTGDDATNFADLQLLADTWLDVLDQPRPTFDDLDARGYAGAFRDDVVQAFDIVPEPGSAGLLAVAAGAALLRRRRRTGLQPK